MNPCVLILDYITKTKNYTTSGNRFLEASLTKEEMGVYCCSLHSSEVLPLTSNQ